MQENTGFNNNFQGSSTSYLRYLHKEYFAALVYFASKIINNSAEAEDIVAESFTKLWERLSNFNEENQIRSFLYITTRNACFNFLRDAKRHALDEQDVELFLYTDDIMAETDVLEAIRDEVNKLSPACKTVFELLYFKNLSRTDVAAKLGISLNTVDNQRKKAVKDIRAALLARGIPIIYLYLFFKIV